MPDERRRLYWDSCVFLSYLNGDSGRADVMDQLHDEATTDELEIFTSMVSEVEVAFGKAEQDQSAPDETVLAAIEAFWVPPSPVKMVEFHRLIARQARQLVREVKFSKGGKRLTPMDAIHLATAQQWEVDEFQTYDGDLLKLPPRFSFAIREPWTPTPRLPGMP